MKVVILAGGFGTRITEESHLRPKPMIEIGNRPILWHIMKIYSYYGFTEFIICCGYKGFMIKEYFANYFLHMSDVTFNMITNKMEVHQGHADPWKVTLVDTGEKTQTGGRIKKIVDYIDGTFCLTYGDGVIDLNIKELIEYHRVKSFLEKPKGDNRWISGGFFVCEPEVINRIDNDDTIWEREPLEGLAKDRELSVFKHEGFWAAMDTQRDKEYLETLWNKGNAPWKIW